MTTKLATESFDSDANTGAIIWQVQVPLAQEYTVFAIPFNCTVKQVDYVLASGACDLRMQINDGTKTDIGGMGTSGAPLSVTTTPQSATGSAPNTVTAGDNIIALVSNLSSPLDLAITLTIERTR